jgi:aminoglycoside phosphotransferase
MWCDSPVDADRPGVEFVASAVAWTPLAEHDGRSGARLERVVLADGQRLVVKRFDPANDLAMAISDDSVGRELLLWLDGALDGLGPAVGHPIVAGWFDDGIAVLAMRDLGDAVLGWDRVLSRGECGRLFGAMLELHRLTRERTPAHACPLELRVGMLAPRRMVPFAAADHPLPAAVTKGWQHFFDLVPADVADAIRSIHADPGVLATALATRPTSLIHGDLFFPNIALEPEQVTFIDWGLATRAPSWLEVTMFLIGSMSNVDATTDELVDDFRRLSGPGHDEVAMRLSMLCTLADIGWNKALDAVEHSDSEKRRRELDELRWWEAQARRTLESGLVDLP